MRIDHLIQELATPNLGLVSRRGLLAAGISARSIARRVELGSLVSCQPGLYRSASVAASHDQALTAALWAAGEGAAISHRAAARHWGITEGFVQGVELTVPIHRTPRLRDATVHRSSDLAGHHLRRRGSLTVTTVERTLADLGAVTSGVVVAAAVERAVIDRHTTITRLYGVVDELGRPGRHGIAALRHVLDAWLLGDTPPDSVLEPMMARLLHRHGLPPAAFQHVIRDGGRFVAKIDFAWPASGVIAEVDGLHAHSTAAALRHDLARQNELVALGYGVLRFTWADVVDADSDVAATLATQLRERSAA